MIEILVFAIIGFMVGIFLCVWVYDDAQNRRMNSVFWALVVLVFGLIGLVIYLLIREDYERERMTGQSFQRQKSDKLHLKLDAEPRWATPDAVKLRRKKMKKKKSSNV
jgi:hypothetical protein